MKIGLLTGGGDCPGLNGVIRAVVLRAAGNGDECVGFLDGWRGPLEGQCIPLDATSVRDILPDGGTILGTSRTNISTPERIAAVKAALAGLGIDALVPIGGEDTLGAATRLAQAGVACVGVPKTIDNDLSGTDVTFGFTTAVQIAVDAVDRVRTTSASHHRAIVVEVMGRHAGWIAFHVGVATAALATLVPEERFDLDAIAVRVRAEVGRRRPAIIVVAEGALPVGAATGGQAQVVDEFGHVAVGGIADYVAAEIGRRAGVETRFVVLGHVQRGGVPTAFDRVLTTRLGIAAADAVHEGKSGVMVAARGDAIVTVPLAEATGTLRTVPPEEFRAVTSIV